MTYKIKNQTTSQIQTEHQRRVMAALDDFQKGRKEPPCRERQLDLFDEHQKERQ